MRNSLICGRKPISQLFQSSFQQAIKDDWFRYKHRRRHDGKSGIRIWPNRALLKEAPTEKKNRIRKSHAVVSVQWQMYCEMGLVAIMIPATNARFRDDRPIVCESSAIPRRSR